MNSLANGPLMWVSLAISITLGALGQILMKMGMNAAGPVSLDQSVSDLAIYFIRAFFSPWVLAAIFSYAIGIIFWLGVLSVADLSLVRPLMSAGYLITLAYGIYAGESITLDRIIGTMLIIGGMYFLTRSTLH